MKKKVTSFKKASKVLEKNEDVADKTYLNSTDPNSRLMKNHGKIEESYNAQITSNNQFITTVDVTNEENDQNQLEPTIEQLEDNKIIDSTDKTQLLADAGYNKGENLEYLDKKENIDAYIAMNDRKEDNKLEEEKEFSKVNFEYDEEKDEYICPKGEILENYGEKIKDNKQITLYHAKREVCLFCKLRSKCITTKNDQKLGYRTLTDDGYLIYRKQMKAKMLEEQSQYIYKKRGVDVEATFGQIKHNKNFRYFTYRGLKKVKTQFLLVCLGHNINKLIGYKIINKNFRKIYIRIILL